MTKYIFIDLDECLFHCRYLGTDKEFARPMTIATGYDWKLIEIPDAEIYASSLRPGALDLLAELRKIPDSRLSVLTASIRPYAEANNEVHGLGFDHAEIFSREDMQSRQSLDPDRFGSGPVYLIDNLPRGENRNKIQFLRDVATNGVEYYRVPEYWAHPSDLPFTPEIIEKIVLTIKELDNS